MPSGDSSHRRTLSVVGGTYGETCHFPRSREIYGSGLRAAAAIAQRDCPVILHTCVAKERQHYLDRCARVFGFATNVTPTGCTINFDYIHSLAEPTCYLDGTVSYPLEVIADDAIVFGMIEGQPGVTATSVVYDPQSPGSPQPFEANGSRAKRVAMICNRVEARKLTGVAEPREAGRALLRAPHTAVAVVKAGAIGAWVITGDDEVLIPPFRSTITSLVGSGDVFTAEFGYQWLVMGVNPVVAATAASRSAASYCATRVLPVSVSSTISLEPVVPLQASRTVYLAGPFFNPAELAAISQAKDHLEEQGVKVFSPYHHVGMSEDRNVAEQDLRGLESCEIVFALLDHFDPGTLFEIGYARALGKPVIVVLSSRQDDVHLTMLAGSGCQIFRNYVQAIYSAAWQ